MRRLGMKVLAIAVMVVGCGDHPSAAILVPDGPATFKVMTQNLYLGGDLDPAFEPDADVPAVVDQIWASVQATDFEARAKIIAASIDTADPDIVGLQEVSLWRMQTPGDGLLIPDATTVAFDFLDILSRELAARGLSYRVVTTVTNGDIELPGTMGTDYRLTDRDVILAKTSLPIVSTSSGRYPHSATVSIAPPSGGPPIEASIPRGWVSIQFRSGGTTIRFFNTHLEAFSPEVATLQAQDLLALANPTAQPTVIVGDMNLPAGSTGYATFVAPETGLRDAWTQVNGDDDLGVTCCWSPDLLGGGLHTRIDLVFATSQLRASSAQKVDETERTPEGRTPSDHAGVVVELTTVAPPASAIAATPLRMTHSRDVTKPGQRH